MQFLETDVTLKNLKREVNYSCRDVETISLQRNDTSMSYLVGYLREHQLLSTLLGILTLKDEDEVFTKEI